MHVGTPPAPPYPNTGASTTTLRAHTDQALCVREGTDRSSRAVAMVVGDDFVIDWKVVS